MSTTRRPPVGGDHDIHDLAQLVFRFLDRLPMRARAGQLLGVGRDREPHIVNLLTSHLGKRIIGYRRSELSWPTTPAALPEIIAMRSMMNAAGPGPRRKSSPRGSSM